MSEHAYSSPDTSDKRPDECWVEYWDRKRHERHGENCGCPLCYNEDIMPADHTWCKHTYENDPDGTCQVPVARCHWDNEKICEPVARMDHVFCSWSCYEEWMESFL